MSKIRDAATSFREAILRCASKLTSRTLQNFPHGSCGDASLLLGKYLDDNGLGVFDYVSGRIGDRTHAWLQKEGVIVDITADQFGADIPGVIVTEIVTEDDGSWHGQFEPVPCNPWDCPSDIKSALLDDYRMIVAEARDGT